MEGCLNGSDITAAGGALFAEVGRVKPFFWEDNKTKKILISYGDFTEIASVERIDGSYVMHYGDDPSSTWSAEKEAMLAAERAYLQHALTAELAKKDPDDKRITVILESLARNGRE